MPKNNKKLTASQQDELESGEDLALAALSQASNNDDLSEEDEVAKSDEMAQTLTSLQNLIERNASALDEIKDKLKQQRDQLRSVFENDSTLSEAEEQAKTYSTQVRERKSQLMADQTVIRLKNDVAELRQQQKEIEESLSNHLVNYYQLTNSRSFDTSDGDQREFEIKARIKGGRKN